MVPVARDRNTSYRLGAVLFTFFFCDVLLFPMERDLYIPWLFSHYTSQPYWSAFYRYRDMARGLLYH